MWISIIYYIPYQAIELIDYALEESGLANYLDKLTSFILHLTEPLKMWNNFDLDKYSLRTRNNQTIVTFLKNQFHSNHS